MFILKVDPKFIIIFPQRLPRIHIFNKNYTKLLEISQLQLGRTNNLKLLALTNRQQAPTAACARGLSLFFSHVNVPFFLMNKKGIPLSIHYSIFQHQDAPVASHHSPGPVLALTDGFSLACEAFLFPSQYTHTSVSTIDPDQTLDFKVFISSIHIV